MKCSKFSQDTVAGWLEGTEVKETELFDIHGTLVAWHKHLGKTLSSNKIMTMHFNLIPKTIDTVDSLIEQDQKSAVMTILS